MLFLTALELLRPTLAETGGVHMVKKHSSPDWEDDPTVLEMWCGLIVYVKDDGSTVPSGADFAERQPPADCKACPWSETDSMIL